jgi:DNA-binding GntR family transcriptional regulator
VLAFDALVTMTMRRGAYVTEVNAKDLRDVFHLIAVLEADAVGWKALDGLAPLRWRFTEALDKRPANPS